MQLLLKLRLSSLGHRWPLPILAILLRPFGPKHFKIIGLSNLSTLRLSWYYSRNALYALNLISTFLFQAQQAQLQNMLEQTSETRKMNEVDSQEKVKQMEMKKQHDNNIVSQLKIIVAEKEAKVHTLEDEIRQLKLNVSVQVI